MKQTKQKLSEAEEATMIAAYDAWAAKNPEPAMAEGQPLTVANVKALAKDIERFFLEHPELGFAVDVFDTRINFYRIKWQ
jgi:hypothetical protein